MFGAWKTFVLFAVFFALAAAVRHRADRLPVASRPSEDEIEGKLETIVQGRIVCQGEGKEGMRPYLFSPEYPKIILHIVSTNAQGWYRLHTGFDYDFHQVIYLTVRHQCDVMGLSPMPRCAVPYFTTEIAIDTRNTTYVMRSVELYDQAQHTRADCLY